MTLTSDVGSLSPGSSSYYLNSVNTSQPDALFKVNLGGTANRLSASLTELTGDANLRLIYDGNSNGIFDAGEEIATSTNLGTVAEQIERSDLAAGTYYIDVYQGDPNVQTSFRLDFNA